MYICKCIIRDVDSIFLSSWPSSLKIKMLPLNWQHFYLLTPDISQYQIVFLFRFEHKKNVDFIGCKCSNDLTICIFRYAAL